MVLGEKAGIPVKVRRVFPAEEDRVQGVAKWEEEQLVSDVVEA